MPEFSLPTLISTLLVDVIIGLVGLLSKKNGSDVRVVWYLFSLTALLTLAVAWIAIHAGVIAEGKFVGVYGGMLNRFLSVMLDLNKDFVLISGITGLILVPQVVCYALSGLSGNAKSPILMSASFSFLMWGFIKPLVVSSSIILSLSALCLLGLLRESQNTVLLFVVTGLYALCLGFAFLSMYREGEAVRDFLLKFPPFQCIHGFCTRNENAVQQSDEVDLMELSPSVLNAASEITMAAIKYNAQTSQARAS